MKYIISLSLLMVLLGCQDAKKDKRDAALEAYKLIDADRADEAIVSLEEALKSDPSNYDYQVTLASAYAQKSGVRIADLPLIVKKIKAYEDKTDEKSLKKIIKNSKNEHEKKLFMMFLYIRKFQYFVQVFGVLPGLDKDQIVNLKQALRILDSVAELHDSERVLRMYYNVIYFKYILSHEFADTGRLFPESCTMNLNVLAQSMKKILNIVNSYVNDDTIINPSKKSIQLAHLADFEEALFTLRQTQNEISVNVDVLNQLNLILPPEVLEALRLNCLGKVI